MKAVFRNGYGFFPLCGDWRLKKYIGVRFGVEGVKDGD